MAVGEHDDVRRGNSVRGCACEACRASRARKLAWYHRRKDLARIRAGKKNAGYRAKQALLVRSWRKRNRARHLETRRAAYARDPELHRAYRRAYYARHPERERAAWARRRELNPGWHQAWADRHPEKYMAKRERDRATIREHRATYRANRVRAGGGRRVPELHSGPRYRPPAGSTGACWICSLPMFWRHAERRLRPSRDHIQPISLGGRHEPGNLAWAHRSCNSARGNHRMPSDQSWAAFVEHRRVRIGALIATDASGVDAG